MPESMTPEERADWIHRITVLSDKLDLTEQQRAETARIAAEAHEAAETATAAVAEAAVAAVKAASAALTAKDTADRQKWLLRGVLVLVALMIFGLLEQRGDGEDLAASQVTTCQNANNTREAQRALWSFVLAASAQDEEDPAPADVQFRREFGAWVNTIFADRDCSDLTKKYPLPDPPQLPTQTDTD